MLQDLIGLINEFVATGAEVTIEEDGQINVHSDAAELFDEDEENTMEHLRTSLQAFVTKYSNGESK